MMKLNLSLLLILMVSLITFSCNDEDPIEIIIPTDPDFFIDLNEDGVDDYKVSFSSNVVEDLGACENVIDYHGQSFISLNNNLILATSDLTIVSGTNVISNINQIENEPPSPLIWSERGFVIVSIQRIPTNNCEWQKEWQTTTEQGVSNLVGLKIIVDGEEKLGYIRLTSDKSTGEVQVIEQGLL